MIYIILFIFVIFLAKKITNFQQKQGAIQEMENSLKESKFLRLVVGVIISLIVIIGIGMVSGINFFSFILILIILGFIYKYGKSLDK